MNLYETTNKYAGIKDSFVLSYYIPNKYGNFNESTTFVHDFIINSIKYSKIHIQ